MNVEQAFETGCIDYSGLVPGSTLDIIDIQFVNSDGNYDEVEFAVEGIRSRSGIDELTELWESFCDDELFDINSIYGIEVVGGRDYE